MIRAEQVKVEDEAVAVAVSDVDGQRVSLRNPGEDPVFLGDADVEADSGFELPADDPALEMELSAGEALYGICAEGKKATVHVLRTGAR